MEGCVEMQADLMTHPDDFSDKAILASLEKVVELAMRIQEVGRTNVFRFLGARERMRTIQREIAIVAP